MLYYLLKYLLYIPLKLMFPVIKVGRKNLPKGGAVLVCNHYSAWDIPVLGINIFRKLHFVGKKELFKNKIGAAFFRMMGTSPIDRSKADMKYMRIIIDKLKKNKYVTIFPEGTRNRNEYSDNFDKIKNGAVLFALISGKPIVPMVLTTRPRIFRKNKLLIGKPIHYADHGIVRADKASVAKAGDILKVAMEGMIGPH